MKKIEDKSAIITGASRGIGAATARELARQGAKVLLLARSTAELDMVVNGIIQEGGIAEAAGCDVSRYDEVASAVKQCVETFGSVDILVNNAGVIDPICRLADSNPEQWDRVVDINYKGVYHGLRAAIPQMVSQGAGVIVNISSGAATGALEGWSHYCSTKAAVLSLTRCVDKEYRELGVRVVGLSPGTVATDMQTAIKSSGINPVSQLDPSVHIPAEWAARAVAWLCTEEASDLAGTDFSIKTEEGRLRAGLV